MPTKKNSIPNTKGKQAKKQTHVQSPSLIKRCWAWFVNNMRSTDDLTEEERQKRNSNRRFICGVLMLALSTGILLALLSHFLTGAADQHLAGAHEDGEHVSNWLGTVGYYVAHYLIDTLFGVPTIFMAVFCVALSMRVMNIVPVRIHKWFLNCTILTLWGSVAMGYLMKKIDWLSDGYINWSGKIGTQEVEFLLDRVGEFGTPVAIIIVALLYVAYVSEETITTIREWLTPEHKEEEEILTNLEMDSEMESSDRTENAEADENPEEETDNPFFVVETAEEITETPFEDDAAQTATTIDFSHQPITGRPSHLREGEQELPLEFEEEAEKEMNVVLGQEPERACLEDTHSLEPYDPKLDLEHYQYPTIDLLKKYDLPASAIDMEEQQANKTQIINVLRTFGVEISNIKATVGPTITLYEITPAPGVRIRKIQNLENDIALSLRALGIRIIAPIPGKGTIGIEVPNAKPQMVSMESIINTRKFQETDFELPMALGKTITNEVFMVDLAKMPHLLVAGATGQGKSVGLNAILTSLLYKKHPAELKLVMVDPKKVEFSVYNPIINHFLAQVEGNEGEEEPIITDVKKVVQTLNSLCVEMDTRYDLLKQARARNVKEYNQKFRDRQLNPLNGHKFMPYIVVVIDEFGDLIMTAGKEVELPIARIAQLARAVGIHMIIATQRPTTNIITGTIKANFPARMAFKVSAMIDSRTILDRPGANQLVGRGDMLFLAGGEPVRVQCAFVDTPEVEAICNFIARQQGYLAPFPLPEVAMEEDGGGKDVDMTTLDALFEECARVVVSDQIGSTSMIQRKFSIGYNRAGRIMDQIEQAGIVGPAHGAKPREVLVQSLDQLQEILNMYR